MIKETRQEIIDAWDEYKNTKIDKNEDWTEEHDNYLLTEYISVKNLKKTKQLACLESWCISRNRSNKAYCDNCKVIHQ